ncbi:hypothetical protein AVEN_124317-1 [Araneus ventricosus]|uniref:Tc1-like transposase DDE domain-containing protein n=1 Tax=Araneus ventricosus TaxID=182803 RepID=A0A4Y2HKK5_ARAVE|nr:hypothetical protein AVEN_93199-1 [Araneus ventricosus]GBM65911.1 hypothetical protein AVEN_124317-1 [Araneus ventricosus]
MSQGSDCVAVFEEHTDEFHLTSWPPNSPDLNPMKHIWNIMELQLRVQTPPCPNIPTLRDRCLDIWYNLSPAMYQKRVASMPRSIVDDNRFLEMSVDWRITERVVRNR